MPSLRERYELGPHKPPHAPCRKCGHGIYKFERFCPFCGRPNDHFDAKDWEERMQMEDFKSCNGYVHLLAIYAADRYREEHERAMPIKFCTQCRYRLQPLSTLLKRK